MMNYLFLLVTVIFFSFQSVTQKAYNKETGGKGSFFFTGTLSLAALLFFLFSGGESNFEIGIVPYSIGFGISYLIGVIFNILAISCGSMSLTALVISYSLMIPTFYGLLFLKEPVGAGLILGILLLITSLFLMNKSEDAAGIPITPKWIIFVLIAFFGNGMCSTVQKMQQVRFAGAYKNEFMIIALAFVFVVCFFASIIKERKNIVFFAQKGWHLALLCGIMNGAVNLLVMIISGEVPSSVMFPVISAGGIILTFFISRFVYKESMSKRQITGLLLGIAAVIFLNIL